MSRPEQGREAVEFIKRLVGAWDCCGTCAGGVLAAHDRSVAAQAWDEGYVEGMLEVPYHTTNPYRPATD